VATGEVRESPQEGESPFVIDVAELIWEPLAEDYKVAKVDDANSQT
jgi:hypothetical protein